MPKPLVSPKADPCPKLGKREANFVACQDSRVPTLSVQTCFCSFLFNSRCARHVTASFQARVNACPSRTWFCRVNVIRDILHIDPVMSYRHPSRYITYFDPDTAQENSKYRVSNCKQCVQHLPTSQRHSTCLEQAGTSA